MRARPDGPHLYGASSECACHGARFHPATAPGWKTSGRSCHLHPTRKSFPQTLVAERSALGWPAFCLSPFARPATFDQRGGAAESKAAGGQNERPSTQAGTDQGTRVNVYQCCAHIARTEPRKPRHRTVRLACASAACGRARHAGTLGPAHAQVDCAPAADPPLAGARQQQRLLAVPCLRHLCTADMRSLIKPFHSRTFFTQ